MTNQGKSKKGKRKCDTDRVNRLRSILQLISPYVPSGQQGGFGQPGGPSQIPPYFPTGQPGVGQPGGFGQPGGPFQIPPYQTPTTGGGPIPLPQGQRSPGQESVPNNNQKHKCCCCCKTCCDC